MENHAPPQNDNSTRAGSKVKFLVGAVIAGIALFFVVSKLVENWSQESTDDAFIDGHVVTIASRVTGEVTATHVTENQLVKAGDPLLELDSRDLEAALAQKQASLQSAQANSGAIAASFDLLRAKIDTAAATQKQSDAQADASKATYENAQTKWNRAERLWTNGTSQVISEQDYDSARAAMTSARAAWRADVEKAESDASRVIESKAQLTAAEKLYEEAAARTKVAEADLHAAELQLSYTKLVAPVDGRVTRKMVEKGAYIQAGQALLAIVRPEIWVTANFKETQTRNIHPGQPVDIRIDGMTRRVLHGHVDSLQSGSGSRFSLLPPENAVGNYVKVVQRVPVKIVFEDKLQAMEGLGPGMSVTPYVQIGPRILSDPAIALIVIVFTPIAAIAFWIFLRQRSQNRTQG